MGGIGNRLEFEYPWQEGMNRLFVYKMEDDSHRM